MDAEPLRKDKVGAASAEIGTAILYPVQYLRAFAAYLVVMFHVSASLEARAEGGHVFAAGAVGVDVFFVLSGFLMALIVAENREVDRRFLLRRFQRIAPLYYVMTLVLFAIAAIMPAWLTSDRLDIWRLVASLLFVPYEASDGSMTPILSLGWTLNYEMFFYCLIALTTTLFGDRMLRGTVLVLIGLAIAGRFADFGEIWEFYTDTIILEFAAGILIYHYAYRELRASGTLLGWIMMAGGFLALIAGPASATGGDRFLSLGLPAVLIVAGGVSALNFTSRWLKRLGDWSYSTYLVHLYLIQLLLTLVAPAGFGLLLDPISLTLIVLPATVAASALLYYGFEQPVRRRLKGPGQGVRKPSRSALMQPAE